MKGDKMKINNAHDMEQWLKEEGIPGIREHGFDAWNGDGKGIIMAYTERPDTLPLGLQKSLAEALAISFARDFNFPALQPEMNTKE